MVLFYATGIQMNFLNPKRIISALRYSYDGLRSTLKEEAAFQQKLIFGTILTLVVFCIHLNIFDRLLLIGSLTRRKI